jgi:membrane associated rhomboid family serine protease
MPRAGASPLSFPEFRGATRRLILINAGVFFAVLAALLLRSDATNELLKHLAFRPDLFLHGEFWQPLTYSFIHLGILGTALELLSLWFMAGFLEQMHTPGWVTGLYVSSVLGTAAAALAIYAVSGAMGMRQDPVPLYGCFGGIFGLLVAIGILYGDMEFLLFFTIGIKARHMAILYGLISIAMLFTGQRVYAFAELGGALAGWIFLRTAPRRGINFLLSEKVYGLRNGYYRWKRRRAAKKFEVYMRSQGRTVRFDGQGRQLDEDPDDKKRWN